MTGSRHDRADDDGVRIIKRYANRKLYDTVDRAFTTLTAVEALVAKGIDVRVVDHDTGDDLTEVVLARALGSVVRASGASAGAMLSSLLRTPERISHAVANDADADQAEEVRSLRAEVAKLTGIVNRLVQQPGDEEGHPR